MRRLALMLVVAALAACPRKTSPPIDQAKPPIHRQPKICAEAVLSARLPDSAGAVGRYSVELGLGDPVLDAHAQRLAKLGIEPNGEAWAGIMEQCAHASLDGVELDPEAGSLHAWVRDAAAAQRFADALCRAISDDAWLDACLARIDRDLLDD